MFENSQLHLHIKNSFERNFSEKVKSLKRKATREEIKFTSKSRLETLDPNNLTNIYRAKSSSSRKNRSLPRDERKLMNLSATPNKNKTKSKKTFEEILSQNLTFTESPNKLIELSESKRFTANVSRNSRRALLDSEEKKRKKPRKKNLDFTK